MHWDDWVPIMNTYVRISTSPVQTLVVATIGLQTQGGYNYNIVTPSMNSSHIHHSYNIVSLILVPNYLAIM